MIYAKVKPKYGTCFTSYALNVRPLLAVGEGVKFAVGTPDCTHPYTHKLLVFR